MVPLVTDTCGAKAPQVPAPWPANSGPLRTPETASARTAVRSVAPESAGASACVCAAQAPVAAACRGLGDAHRRGSAEQSEMESGSGANADEDEDVLERS